MQAFIKFHAFPSEFIFDNKIIFWYGLTIFAWIFLTTIVENATFHLT